MLSELEISFSGNDQEILCALGDMCHRETPDKESFPRIAKFHEIDGEILEAEQKIYASFRRERWFHSQLFQKYCRQRMRTKYLICCQIFPMW